MINDCLLELGLNDFFRSNHLADTDLHKEHLGSNAALLGGMLIIDKRISDSMPYGMGWDGMEGQCKLAGSRENCKAVQYYPAS